MKRDEAELEAATTEMALCNRETEAVNEGAKEAEKDVTLTDLKADHNGLDN